VGQVKVMGKKGESDLNRSREILSSRAINHPVWANDHPCAEVRVWPGERTFVLGRMARGRTITPGGAIVRLLSVFSTLERVSANDRPRGVNVRFLSV
jgi:hypothetical protein